MPQDNIKDQINKFANQPLANHLVYCTVMLFFSYYAWRAIGEVDGNGAFFYVLCIITLVLLLFLLRPWIMIARDGDFKTRVEAMWVGYGTVLFISAFILLSWVSPHQATDDTLCYKLTTGETVCYSEREIKKEICKNVDCR